MSGKFCNLLFVSYLTGLFVQLFIDFYYRFGDSTAFNSFPDGKPHHWRNITEFYQKDAIIGEKLSLY